MSLQHLEAQRARINSARLWLARALAVAALLVFFFLVL